MNLTTLRFQIDDLKLMLLDPKLYINKYFDDIINQLDIQTTKYQNEEATDSKEIYNCVENWRQLIIEELKKAENEFLNRITPEFKLNDDLKLKAENILQKFIGELDCDVLLLENYDSLYETSFDIKRHIMNNQCFVILNEEIVKSVDTANIKSNYLWENILPMIRINGVFTNEQIIK